MSRALEGGLGRRWCWVLACGWLGACGSSGVWSGETPAPDYAQFEQTVYPILLRDCAFSECHGNEGRFFQVWGPGRTRLDPLMRVDESAVPAEVMTSYERARSMLVSETPGNLPPLLAKPLEERAGGAGHKGVDAFGRNVYQSPQDPSFVSLLQWAQALPLAVLPTVPADQPANQPGSQAPAQGGQP